MNDPEYKYTPEEYWKLLETFPTHKYEYIHGNVRMMTGGSPAHAHISANIVRLLGNALVDSDCNVYSSDAALQLSYDRIYFPDASVSCDPLDWTNKKALESPSVVVEVLSPSTEKTDRGEKLEAYRQYPTIQDILLVDARRCYVEHYHRVGMAEWTNFLYHDRDAAVHLSSIDAQLSVREIYLKVYLELED